MPKPPTVLDTPCLEWQGTRSPAGYGRVRNGSTRPLVHRFVWEAAVGPIPDGMLVMHRCDNPPCYRLDHLQLGTNPENMADMRRKNRQAHGEESWCAKLTAEQVIEMRTAYAGGGWTHRRLGERFGISHRTAGMIVSGRKWTHVQQQPPRLDRGLTESQSVVLVALESGRRATELTSTGLAQSTIYAVLAGLTKKGLVRPKVGDVRRVVNLPTKEGQAMIEYIKAAPPREEFK